MLLLLLLLGKKAALLLYRLKDVSVRAVCWVQPSVLWVTIPKMMLLMLMLLLTLLVKAAFISHTVEDFCAFLVNM